ncbi:MAG: LysR family transcriptional regulator, partial [Porticoccaceae bacterium]|nr:LysR family transcriptional regulator [Porticoccaceae bacterium]
MKNLPMDILRAFVAVADVKSVTLAGELLSRSQPAVSLQLKRLEDLIGKPLFNRSGKKLELTQSGTQLLGYAREILALNDEALSHFVEPDLSGTIRLGLPNEFATTLLPKVVGQFAKSHPNVTLEVTSDLSKNLMSRARERFDIVLALEEDPCHCDEPLIKVDELVWVTSSAHAAHQQEV